MRLALPPLADLPSGPFRNLLVLFLVALVTRCASAGITWDFEFRDSPGEGFFDDVLGEERRRALFDVADYISSVLDHSGTIQVLVIRSENNTSTPHTALAAPRPALEVGFTNGYPYLHATSGIDPDPGLSDAIVQVNFGFPYYLGEDPAGIPDTQIDLRSVILHELAHVLGVLSFADRDGSSVQYMDSATGRGIYSVFDSHLHRGVEGADPLFPDARFAKEASDLVSGDIWFHGANAMAANGNQPVKIFAPGGFLPGSSLSHFDSSVNSIMQRSIPFGSTVRTFSDLDLAVLRDLGWNVVPEPGTVFLAIAAAVPALRRRRARGAATRGRMRGDGTHRVREAA